MANETHRAVLYERLENLGTPEEREYMACTVYSIRNPKTIAFEIKFAESIPELAEKFCYKKEDKLASDSKLKFETLVDIEVEHLKKESKRPFEEAQIQEFQKVYGERLEMLRRTGRRIVLF